jgi:hypothetical protein
MIEYFTFNYNKDPNDKRLYCTDCESNEYGVQQLIQSYVSYGIKHVPASCIKRLKTSLTPGGFFDGVKLSELEWK